MTQSRGPRPGGSAGSRSRSERGGAGGSARTSGSNPGRPAQKGKPAARAGTASSPRSTGSRPAQRGKPAARAGPAQGSASKGKPAARAGPAQESASKGNRPARPQSKGATASTARASRSTGGGAQRPRPKDSGRDDRNRRAAPSATSPARRPPRPPRPARPARKPRPPRVVRLADPRRRLRVSFLLICVLVSVLAGRVVQLQGFEASGFAAEASRVNVHDVVLPAQRGAIVDRNGNVLAQSVDAYDVVADQKIVTEHGNAAAYALELAGILGEDAASLQRELTGESQYHYLAKSVSPQAWSEIQNLDPPLTGIFAEPVSERIYPSGTIAGNVLGFTGADGAGLAGLELARQDLLGGVDGSMTYQATRTDVRIPLGTGARDEPTAGQGVQLTLDRDIQWYAEKAIAEAVASANAAGGNVVVMDVRTGEILAMATAPVVNPEEPGATETGERGNRVVEEVYEPGSVFKAVTMAAVVDQGEAGPRTVFTVPDNLSRGGEVINDYFGHGPLPFTLSGIVAKSSNVGSVLAAERLEPDVFGDYVRRFGFGTVLDLGLPAEAAGSLPQEWSGLDRDYAAFGQGISVTTVQLASAYATIANGGVRMPPKLVSATLSADGERESVSPDGEPARVISAEAATAVTTMLEAAMGPEGTGRNAAVDGYRVTGKTGTAQRIDPACGCYADYNASFVGFAPADAPRFSIAVSLLDPKNGNSGGALAGPVYQDVMAFTLQTMGVAPSGSEPPEVPLFAGD